MKIISINVNDFGGRHQHREEYKEKFGAQGIQKWDEIDKKNNIDGILSFFLLTKPDVIVMQEFDINSNEAKNFNIKMTSNGYLLESENVIYKRPSMTVFYVKKSLEHTYISVGHTKNGRAYAIKVEDLIIYGTHVPPKYDAKFWNEIHNFVEEYKDEKYILIGDYNTINCYNMRELKKLLKSSIDIWKEKDKTGIISVAGDYAIISKKCDIEKISIDKKEDMNQYTDHPAVIVTFN